MWAPTNACKKQLKTTILVDKTPFSDGMLVESTWFCLRNTTFWSASMLDVAVYSHAHRCPPKVHSAEVGAFDELVRRDASCWPFILYPCGGNGRAYGKHIRKWYAMHICSCIPKQKIVPHILVQNCPVTKCPRWLCIEGPSGVRAWGTSGLCLDETGTGRQGDLIWRMQ